MRTKFDIYVFYYYNWIDTSTCGLLVPEDISRPVASASALTWFVKHIHYWNLQSLNVII
jgi:hypothetical protein